jgi:Fic family protein
MAVYIHQLPNWPRFNWDTGLITTALGAISRAQGRLLGKMGSLGFSLQAEANLQTLTLEVTKSSEIEGDFLDRDEVRSSIARKLGMDIPGLIPAERHIDGIVEMMLDATQQSAQPLSDERLFGWHAALFPTGHSGAHKIVVAGWRNNTADDPMQVVSGAAGREVVHFEAPGSERLSEEMNRFIRWFNEDNNMDPLLKAAVAHLWLVTIHPFDDGNGRIARAVTELQLARADESIQRFYSMSAQIRKDRSAYYKILESTQKSSLDITEWMRWFLECLHRAITTTDETLHTVLKKAAFWEKHRFTIMNKRQQSTVNKLLDGFEGKLNTSKWAKINKTSSDTALRDIQDLIAKDVLGKEESSGKNTSYIIVE